MARDTSLPCDYAIPPDFPPPCPVPPARCAAATPATAGSFPNWSCGHDDAIPVVVLDVVEEAHPVGGGKVLLRGVEDAGVGVSLAVGLGYLPHVGFQPDNHRLVRQPQTLHLVGGDAHYQRLAAANFLVANAAAVLFHHPYAILLAGVQVLYAQALSGRVREGLVRAVIFRTHEAVELAVVHIRRRFLNSGDCSSSHSGEAVSDFVNLRVGELDALAVAHLDVVPVSSLPTFFIMSGQVLCSACFSRFMPS